jgi:hypothetical protein
MKKQAKRTPEATAKVKALSLDDQIALDAGSGLSSASPDQLAAILSSVELLRQAQARLLQLQADTESQETEVNRLRLKVLPGMMDEATVKVLGLDDGFSIERVEEVYASISKENLPAVAAWMEQHGHAALVKVAITLTFDKGDTVKIALARKALKARALPYEEKASIHHQTLLAFVKESLADGTELPKQIGVHQQPAVKLIPPKQPKVKKGVLV